MKISGFIVVLSMIFTFSLIAFGNLPKYNVDGKKCIGCTLCVKICPVKAITMTGGKAVIDTEKCIGCGICADGDKKKYLGCPTKAIIKDIPVKKENLSKDLRTADSLKIIQNTDKKSDPVKLNPAVNEK